MRRALIACLLICGLPGIYMANAQTFSPIPGLAPRSVPFDIQGGHYDQWSKYLPCEANVVSFKVEILQSHTNPTWNSQVRVSLSDNAVDQHNSKPSERNAFEWVAMTLVSDVNGIPGNRSFAVIGQHQNGKDIRLTQYPATVVNNREYRVHLRWGAEGEVSASIDGGPDLTLKMGKRVTTLNFYASGVKAEFRDLQIGRIGPKPEGKDACGVS